MSKVEEFKESHRRFSEALEYICKNEETLKATPGKWEKIKINFEKRFEAPLDLVWASLTKDQQKSLAPLYLFRRVAQDKEVKKVMEIFDAKITEVKDES